MSRSFSHLQALRGCDAESKPDFSAAAAAGGVSSIAVSPPGGTPLPPYSSSTHLIKAMELEFAEATGKPVQRGNWGGEHSENRDQELLYS